MYKAHVGSNTTQWELIPFFPEPFFPDPQLQTDAANMLLRGYTLMSHGSADCIRACITCAAGRQPPRGLGTASSDFDKRCRNNM